MKTILNYAQLVKEQHALNKTIAPVETDAADASQAYAIGEQFILDGILYKAKTAIAQHDALVLDSNYEAADNLVDQMATTNGSITTLSGKIGNVSDSIAPTEAGPTAANAYAIGDQLYYNGVLYKAKTAIAVSDALTVGTNIEAADDLTDQITSLNGAIANKADSSKAYQTDDTAETTLDDADYVPFYDTSATAKRKSLWSNIKSVLKTYFDTLYATISDLTTLSTAVSNKHKVTSIEVSTSSWTQDTTSQSGTTLYKKSISCSHVYVDSPTVDIGAASGSVLPTTAQQTAYDLLQYVTVDGTTLYLYASAIPSTQFYIGVEGVD